jgi:hypothetical protein
VGRISSGDLAHRRLARLLRAGAADARADVHAGTLGTGAVQRRDAARVHARVLCGEVSRADAGDGVSDVRGRQLSRPLQGRGAARVAVRRDAHGVGPDLSVRRRVRARSDSERHWDGEVHRGRRSAASSCSR